MRLGRTTLNIRLIIALCFWIFINGVSADELTLDDIFPTDRVLDIQIMVADKDWDTIRYQTRDFFSALHESRKFAPPEAPYTYVDASVTIDGVVFPNVGLRKKGFLGSLSTTRPSLKIKLNHTDKDAGIGGLTNLTLNNNQQDISLMSQFMGYALFNAAGSPAPRCAYAKVTVNGVNLGVYSHVETVRKSFLRRAFGTDDGTLYEGTLRRFLRGMVGQFRAQNRRWMRRDGRRSNSSLRFSKVMARTLKSRSASWLTLMRFTHLGDRGAARFLGRLFRQQQQLFHLSQPNDRQISLLTLGC